MFEIFNFIVSTSANAIYSDLTKRVRGTFWLILLSFLGSFCVTCVRVYEWKCKTQRVIIILSICKYLKSPQHVMLWMLYFTSRSSQRVPIFIKKKNWVTLTFPSLSPLTKSFLLLYLNSHFSFLLNFSNSIATALWNS